MLPLGIALLALLVSLFFHSPRLWVFQQAMPGSTYWDRGLQFMTQCDTPLGQPLSDAALTWRVAPALLAKALGLHGKAALIVPWLGLLVMLTLCARLMLHRTGDRLLATLTVMLVATTNATLTVTGWLGLNDAWYVSALLAVAFLPGWWAVALASLVGPWIDERFLFALPLALYVRSRALGAGWKQMHSLFAVGLGLGFYVAARFLNLLQLPTAGTAGLLQYSVRHFHEWLPWTGLGWFMGLRAAWVPVVVAIGGGCERKDLPAAWWPAALALSPLCLITLLASDTGRAPAMLLPLVLLGTERLLAMRGQADTRRFVGWLLAANLLMPAMHVTYQSGDLINMLPVEIGRLLIR